MKIKNILLITPPFVQLNSPYPATPFLKGYLKTLGLNVTQKDLSIDIINNLFSANGLTKVFKLAQNKRVKKQDLIILENKNAYINKIDSVINFLQGSDSTLAYRIISKTYLPEGARFKILDDLDWAFGSLGIQDKAKYLATLFLEDISDFIQNNIDPNFGVSRYAESISLSAPSFTPLKRSLESSSNFIDNFLIEKLSSYLKEQSYDLICFSVPFPGNLYCALKCGQYIKQSFPNIKTVLGGGYINTELRSLKDPDIFNFVDFITIDDGELPLKQIISYLNNKKNQNILKRTFIRKKNKVEFFNNCTEPEIKQDKKGIPDYSDLILDKYLSTIEIANPMHRLWNDGCWNKIMIAHGCYWHKCAFCDTSLDYINRYEPLPVKLLCDQIEAIIKQTGKRGFHFIDEAAPPNILKQLAKEIINRNINITWWTNVRFEKTFSDDLCRLMAESGCIAVSGGLETPSDHLLSKMSKGVSIDQAAKTCYNFTENGIMVHAYLMYGFPGQTELETVNSLEIIRQFFINDLIQSAFWHHFALTKHSHIYKHPKSYNIKIIQKNPPSFAENEIEFIDLNGCNHQKFSKGLNKALYNYMHGICFDIPAHKWFDFKITKSSINKKYIHKIL